MTYNGGINGYYKQNGIGPSLPFQLPSQINTLTGYDTALKRQVDRFVPNRFTAILQHLGAGGDLTPMINNNSKMQADKYASASKQESLNLRLKTALMGLHFQNVGECIGLINR